MLISGARLRPDRVVDILEACGALDLSSSLSRDVNSYFDFILTLIFILPRFYGVVTPPELNISRGDTISWWSEKRQGNYVLVSEDGLFPDEKLSYRVPFMYTFNETGTYRFIVKNIPEINATIRVN